MTFVLALFYIIIFSFLILKLDFFKIESLSKKVLFGIFALKLFAGFAWFYVYDVHYSDKRQTDLGAVRHDASLIYELYQSNIKDALLISLGFSSDSIEKKYLMSSRLRKLLSIVFYSLCWCILQTMQSSITMTV